MLLTLSQGRTKFLFFLSPLLLTFILHSAYPAHAEQSHHCIIERTQDMVCFDTFTEALRVASKGTLTVQDDTELSTLTEGDLAMAGILALLYDARDQTGISLAIVGDTCGVSGDMPASWNNRVSSGRTGTCGVYLYDGTHQTGNRVFMATPGTNYVGDLLNNRASSWRIP